MYRLRILVIIILIVRSFCNIVPYSTCLGLLLLYWYLKTTVRRRGSLFGIVVGVWYSVRETCRWCCSVLRRDVKFNSAVHIDHYPH